MELVALVVYFVFIITGLFAIFFTTIGTIGVLIFALMTGFNVITFQDTILIFFLYILGEVVEYFSIVVGTKAFGGSNKAVIGGLVGGILGATLGMSFFGIGLFAGTILGIFLGVFVIEIVRGKKFLTSLKAGAGGIVGRFGSIIAKLMIAIVMIGWSVYRMVHRG